MKKKSQTNVPDVRNFVHKHMETFSKAQTFVDRKKDQRNGKRKHKGQDW
ncbi:hypothetical protein EJP02_067 [Escherichia phage EJP2]|nr:hypothetical protein EJP02_067 [Escherichia phage EJP2]